MKLSTAEVEKTCFNLNQLRKEGQEAVEQEERVKIITEIRLCCDGH